MRNNAKYMKKKTIFTKFPYVLKNNKIKITVKNEKKKSNVIKEANLRYEQ